MEPNDNFGHETSYRRRYRNKTIETPPVSKAVLIKESLKSISREYCAESSICGLKHLVDERTSFVERIIWVITLLCGLVVSAALVRVTFTKFFEAPLVTTQTPEGISVSRIVFPAVGVCSNNRMSRAAVAELARTLLKEERNKMYNESEMMDMLFDLGQFYTMYSADPDAAPPMKLHRALGEYDVDELMRKLAPSCNKLLLRCSWNDEATDCKDLFDYRLTMNGYCCTFNYLRTSDMFEEYELVQNIKEIKYVYVALHTDLERSTDTLRLTNVLMHRGDDRGIDMYNYGNKSTFDYDQGLKVLMKFNESDDFFYNIPLEGAQFSDSYDFPDAPSGSFAMQIISSSVQMTVLVSASFTEASRDIQHVDVKLRGCLFYDESPYLPFYTSSDCYLKCRMQFLLAKCNCTPFNMPKMAGARTCDLSDITCVKKYFVQSINVRPRTEPVPKELQLDLVGGGIACPMCYPTCSKTSYTYDFFNVNMYPDNLNAVPDQERMPWLRGANFTGTSIVHVKYAREYADCYGQNVIMKWFDLISNIGSTCGFVTGFSFVSVIEFIYFYTVKLVRDLRMRRRLHHQSRIVSNTDKKSSLTDTSARAASTSAHLEPITRYRPIYWNELAAPVHFRH